MVYTVYWALEILGVSPCLFWSCEFGIHHVPILGLLSGQCSASAGLKDMGCLEVADCASMPVRSRQTEWSPILPLSF
jgi:hypothetical protein